MAEHKSIDKNFFKEWGDDMAYVLGFLFADGNITKSKRGGHYVSLYAMDRDLLSAIKIAMKSDHMLAKRTAQSGSVYRIQIGSKELVADLERLGLKEAKARRMEFPKVPSNYLPHFIRGFFDGDGNVWVGKIHLERKNSMYTIQTAFTSASIEFLTGLKNRLHKEGLMGGSLVHIVGKNCGRLSFSIRDSLKLYDFMYNGVTPGIFLARKKEVFERYICSRSSTG